MEDKLFQTGINAKEITTYLYEAINKPANFPFPRTMIQAKRLLKLYSKDDIIYAIDMYKDKMYSLGYLLPELMGKAIKDKVHDEELKVSTFRGEIESEQSVAERNHSKLQRLPSQSGFGAKHNFDMLTEPKQDT